MSDTEDDLDNVEEIEFFKKSIQSFLKLEEELKVLNGAIKQRRAKKKELCETILAFILEKDLDSVKMILLNLESGLVFAVVSDEVDDKDILKAKIVEFRGSIDDLKVQIEELKDSSILKIIDDYDDVEDYFSDLDDTFEQQLRVLKNRLDELIENE